MGALTRSHTPLPEGPPPCHGTLPSDRLRPSCGPSRPSSPPTVPTSVTSRLDMDWDGHVAIIWEEGPYEWTYHFGTDDVDDGTDHRGAGVPNLAPWSGSARSPCPKGCS